MIKWTQVLHLQHRESGEAVWEEGLRCYPLPTTCCKTRYRHTSLCSVLSFLFGMSWLFWGMVKFGFTKVCLSRCQHWEGKDEKVSHSYHTFQGLTIDNLDPSSVTSIEPHIFNQLVARKTFLWYMHSFPQTMQQHAALSPLAKWETRKSAHASHFLRSKHGRFWYCLSSCNFIVYLGISWI